MNNVNILACMNDPELFGKFFAAKSWGPWKAFCKALFGLPMAESDMAIYTKCTGRTDVSSGYREAYVIAGRRSGKSRVAALIAVFCACFVDYAEVLAAGERGIVMVLSTDRRQCQVILGYIVAFLESVPLLRQLIVNMLKESIELSNGITVEVHVSDYRSVRGFTTVCAILDELSFWPSSVDSASPDKSVIEALRPSLATVPTGLLLAISSPYSRRGALWNEYKGSFGQAGAPSLVWKSDSRTMTPTLSRIVVAKAYLLDRQSADAEYGGNFRTDVEALFSLETVEAGMVKGRRELPPVAGTSYAGFIDSSGGVSDSMVVGITHDEQGVAVLDLIREVVPPFSPENVAKEFSAVLKHYRIYEAVGDRYGAEWVREAFVKNGISYRASERNRSELYLELLPAIMSQQVRLLDHPKLVNQLCGLERRTGRGADVIDHVAGGHDDIANCAAGAISLVLAGNAGTLGVVEYFKGIDSGKYPFPEESPPVTPRDDNLHAREMLQMQMAAQGATSNRHRSIPGTVEACPQCHATSTVSRIGRNEYHCCNCSQQWGTPEVSPKYNRKDLGT